MIFPRLFAFLLLVLFLQTAATAVRAADAVWLSFDMLGGDRPLAEAALSDMFGEDPEFWPDWLDPRAVLLQAGGNQSLLVVREPYRQPCGQYLFIIFGPLTADGTRNRLGTGFCAGDMAVGPVRGRSFPDLLFSEGRQQNPADGQWQRLDQRVRWNGSGWIQITAK
ncbi:hypothetical protein [Telmatospirillum siberiense]|uniref:Uncharacterized protein n=1 Tax=Telmatospirillum siberiense TaxID=382514 RepID=A0A2N3PPF2_9PROT|nr:hypothetical protein [Telmatospirillum siberiense]PKU22256.1 hypothetical protein CWS72_22575 [Telmatospirillum siberiense]